MDESDISAEVRAALARGALAYKAREYDVAEAADQEALALAVASVDRVGEARARRLLGLCAYRRGDSVASAARLEQARELALAIGWEEEDLLVCNHLGATLRKLGRLEDADAVFRDALRRADPRHHRIARARLLGSYGAFHDDLGDERAAAEYYARYDELLAQVDDPGRQANARGLVSRAARLRGDLDLAEAKALEERDLGARGGDRLREGRGWMHYGQALAARGDAQGADEALLQADAHLAAAGDARTPVDIAVARGRFYLEVGRLHDAHEQVERARRTVGALSAEEHEHRAKVSELAAGVAAEAGLHGEALWHIGDALESQLRRFEPISDPRLQRLTQGRRRHLATLARRAMAEAAAVDRAPGEVSRVAELVHRLGEGPVLPDIPPTTVDAWRKRVRAEAERRWRRLLPFSELAPAAQEDLVLCDVVSQGTVGDLGRGLLLLLGTIERELHERVLAPLRPRVAHSRRKASLLQSLLSQARPAGLGTLIAALLQPPEGFAADDPRVVAEPFVGALGGLALLREPVVGLDGRALPSPVDVRNTVAHGRAWAHGRIDADAIRRVLTLGNAATLVQVMSLKGA